MKIERSKKCQKVLNYYTLNFDYRTPFQILIDATFCQAALQNQVSIDEQLRKYLQQSELKLLTTQCSILEAESLGPVLTGATQIVKKFFVHKCGHESKPITASACFLAMTKKSRYIIATQDRELQEKIRKIAGQALIYLHRSTPILDEISCASKKLVNFKTKQCMLPKQTKKAIKKIKRLNGIESSSSKNSGHNYKLKSKRKNPNPLSCKKKKKKVIKTGFNDTNKN